MAFSSGWSMKGPFFCERMLLRLPLHDELVSSFVVSRLVAERGLTPRRHRMISLNPALAATMGMIHGIHHDPTNRRTNSDVPVPACFSDRHVFVIEIADLTDCGRAIHIHEPHLTGWKFDVSIPGFFCNNLCGSAGTACHL